jgi:hypothetical protein
MTARDRVRNAVRQQPSDRVPTLHGDFSWISLPNTRTNRPEGGFIDEWGVTNIPRDGMCHGERMHPVTTIAGEHWGQPLLEKATWILRPFVGSLPAWRDYCEWSIRGRSTM